MLLKQIRYFLAVVDNESFTKAAEQCGVSQSAISQQVKALEDGLGVRLLNRHNRTFSLTRAGKYFYNNARGISDEVEALRKETISIGNKESATE